MKSGMRILYVVMEFIKSCIQNILNFFHFFLCETSPIPLAVAEAGGRAALFLKEEGEADKVTVVYSDDGFNFNASSKTLTLPKALPNFPNAVILKRYRFKNQKVMFFGNRALRIAYSTSNNHWVAEAKPLIKTARPVELSNVFLREEGILAVYYEKIIENERMQYFVHLALFAKENPEELIFQTEKPVWRQADVWSNQEIKPLGAIFIGSDLITYWLVDGKIISGAVLTDFTCRLTAAQKKPVLAKHTNNPLIKPRQANSWEAFNTFNPAALYVGGKVHLLYRAQGFDYISVIGYAASLDGTTINERLDEPVYSPNMAFENNLTGAVNQKFVSAGGYGGCEDARLTLLGDKIYMTYVAFDGWNPPRLALTCILLKDFLAKRWLWSKPVLISPPGIVDKSGCLLPEKINGKYVFFHRVFPDILVDFVDDLLFDGKSKWLRGEFRIKIRADRWDSRKIGIGAPPIKTTDGWLAIYYGVDDRDASRYHIGAMLLDLDNPTKVLYRSDEPILCPEEEYELNGFKPGICYPCGAVVIKNQLLVYYGGADSVVCVASAEMTDFLAKLKSHQSIYLNKVEIKEINY